VYQVGINKRITDTVHCRQWGMEKLNLFMFHYNNMRNLQLEHIQFGQERKHKLPQSESVKRIHYFAPIYKYNYSLFLLWRANSGVNEQLSFHQNNRRMNGEHWYSDSYWRKKTEVLAGISLSVPLGLLKIPYYYYSEHNYILKLLRSVGEESRR
jgi:hypothetical protein